MSPLAVVNNWKLECNKFCPKLRIMTYIGSSEDRKNMRQTVVDSIMKQPATSRNDPELDFDVLLTTPEVFMKDSSFLKNFKWQLLIIDEAHRFKNPASVAYQMVESIPFARKLLLTGTPIQNNMKELWGLLHLIMPDLFDNLELFETYFADLKDVETADLLHQTMRPFLLRRTKALVLGELPKKTETIIHTGLSKMQKFYYKAVLSKDTDVLSKKVSLINSKYFLKQEISPAKR